MTPNLATLTTLAQAANQTEWPKSIAGIEGDTYIAATGPWYRERGNMTDDRAERDAAFIAACSPDVILALVARVQELTDALYQIRREQHCEHCEAAQCAHRIADFLLRKPVLTPSEPRDG